MFNCTHEASLSANDHEMSGIPDLRKMVVRLSKYSNSFIKIITVSLLPTVFVGHHFAQPRRVQAERSREAVSAPSSVSRRKQREPLNGEASREYNKIKKNRININ